MKMTDKKLKVLGIILLTILTCAFAYVGLFSHPYTDDFGFASTPHAIWQESGSLGAVFRSAIEQTKDTYYTWQGSFGSIFLFSLNPIVFDYEYYWIGSVFLVFLYAISNCFFAFQVFQKSFHFSKNRSIGLASLLVCLLFFTHFSIHEFFYNYISGIYYNFFNALALFSFGIFLSCSFRPSVFQSFLLGILFLIIGSGNYITAILCFTSLVLLLLYFTIKRERKIMLALLLFTLCLSLTLAISVLAPGNAVRQASMDPNLSLSPLKAIASSFVEALKMFIKMLDIKLFIFLILLLIFPFEQKKYKIHPLFLWVISLILTASQFSPILYAQGNTGPDRIVALIFSNTTLLFYSSLLYSFIYYQDKITQRKPLFIALTLALSLGITVLFPPKWNLKYILMDISSNTLQAYHTEKIQRHRFLQNTSKEGMIDVSPIQHIPQSMEVGELLDPNSWVNQSFVRYYQITGIHLKLD